MRRSAVTRAVTVLQIVWLALVVAAGWGVLRSQAFLLPDMRLDQQHVIQPNPQLRPVVLEPLVGKRLERVDAEDASSVAGLPRLSRREPHRLWLREPGPAGELTPVVWSFVRRLPDLRLTDALTVPDSASAAAQAVGLEPGDRIVSVNGQPLRAPRDLLPAMQRLVASPQRLSVVRDRAAAQFESIVQVQDWMINWAIFAAGVAFGLIGLVTYRLRPDTRSALSFLVFASVSSLLWLLRSIPFDNRPAIARQLLVLLRLALPVATVFLLLSFTPWRRIVTRHRLAIAATALACLALGFWNVVQFPAVAIEGVLAPRVSLALTAGTFVLALLSLTSDWMARLLGRRLLPIDRQRSRVLRLATLVGLLPLTLYFLLRFDYRLWCELAVILFPLILAYATIRHNLFQINELLFEGLLYGGLILAVSSVYAALVASVGPLVDVAVGAGQSWVSFGAVALTTLATLPAHNRLRGRMSERFTRHDLTTARLIECGDGPSRPIRSSAELCQEMAHRVADLVGTKDVHILLRGSEGNEWKFMTASESVSPQTAVSDLSPVLDLLVNRAEDVLRDVLDDNLTSSGDQKSAVDAMNAVRASLAIPLKVCGEVWGVLTVGDKATATNYSLSELRALRQLGTDLGVALHHAHEAFAPGDAAATTAIRLATLLPPPPKMIGPYEIERLLGEGGMAFVYLGNRDGRRVAVKVLNDRARRDLKLEKRFRREWQILQDLHHDHVLEVYDCGFAPAPYLVSEYCALGTVRDLLRTSSRLSVPDAVRIARQAALGLRAALDIGVVHRDINPRNLLRAAQESVKVGDFGIAHWDRDILTTHEVLGTPGYLSPEVCAGQMSDWRADQYSLGVTLFEMLAGRRPFGAQRLLDLVAMHLDPVPDLRSEPVSGIGDALADVVRTMMAKEPANRFPSYDVLVEALDRSAPSLN